VGLRASAYGYSLPEIATQLDRNIKTIRAHKFNAMTKLGVKAIHSAVRISPERMAQLTEADWVDVCL
jgi:DNA-binding NarL/FixJ family response regulator